MINPVEICKMENVEWKIDKFCAYQQYLREH